MKKHLPVVLVALSLPACNGVSVGVVREVKPFFPANQTTVTLNSVQEFTVSGTGTCGSLRLDWGDGTRTDSASIDLSSNPRISHVFSGWAGGKTVTAEGRQDCTGRVNTRFTIAPPVYTLGYNHIKTTTTPCNAIPNRPALPARTLVHVTADASPLINFGCQPTGCSYDANGSAAPAGSNFPFPGLLAYSLVLRVGSQVVQGGRDVRFTTTAAGPLEVCMNDDRVTDNVGGWGINIAVDMLGPP
jgi:hypothetical protein